MSISTYASSPTPSLLHQTNLDTRESHLSTSAFHKAIKGYKDEYYTGLTDEEREEILKQQKAYLEDHPLKTPADIEKFNNFTKSLLKKYGYKGDYNEFLITTEVSSDASNLSDIQFAYEQTISSATASKERLIEGASNLNTPNHSTSDDTTEATQSTLITNADGSQTLILLKDDIIVAKFNLGKVPVPSEDMPMEEQSNDIISLLVDSLTTSSNE